MDSFRFFSRLNTWSVIADYVLTLYSYPLMKKFQTEHIFSNWARNIMQIATVVRVIAVFVDLSVHLL